MRRDPFRDRTFDAHKISVDGIFPIIRRNDDSNGIKMHSKKNRHALRGRRKGNEMRKNDGA